MKRARIHARSLGQTCPQCVRMRVEFWWAFFFWYGVALSDREFDTQIECAMDLMKLICGYIVDIDTDIRIYKQVIYDRVSRIFLSHLAFHKS